TLTWGNPRLESLESQALLPLFGQHPVEMGMSGKETLLLSRLRGESRYRVLFAEAFPDKARVQPVDSYSLSTITQALASFQRTLLTFNSNYDRYKYGDDKKRHQPCRALWPSALFQRRHGLLSVPRQSLLYR